MRFVFVGVFFGLAFLVVGTGGEEPKKPSPPAASGGRRALLVACTEYPNLDKRLWLKGPANDVLLFRDTLVRLHGFKTEDIVILSEAQGQAMEKKGKGKDFYPSRANIEREFKHIATVSKPGDQVVILMGGHGSQQPESNRPGADPEPDGLDEIFLPRDVGKWDGATGTVTNAIVDDDMNAWISNIRKKKPSIWLIVDACHSGTMLRGNERTRDVKPQDDLGIPKAALSKAAEDARKRPAPPGERSRGVGKAPPPMHLVKTDGLVAIYAAQAKEVTVERDLPDDAKDAKPYGLLTYTMCQVLSQSAAANRPLTYRELAHRIQQQYEAWGRTFPTPVIEGDDNVQVLGTRVFDRAFHITLQETRNGLKINAGALQGMTVGSILAVRPPTGKTDTVVGHVRIEEVRTTDSEVVPCAFDKMPAAAMLPEGGVCTMVVAGLGDQQVRIAVDPMEDGKPLPPERVKALQTVLAEVAGKNNPFHATSDPKKADWLLYQKKGKVYLAPSRGWSSDFNTTSDRAFGPAPEGDGLAYWLGSSFASIGKAVNLVRLAGSSQGDVLRGENESAVRVKLEIYLAKGKADKKGTTPIVWPSPGLRFHDGDFVVFRITNTGDLPADVTLLYVDSAFGIDSLFPAKDQDNRIQPGKTAYAPVEVTASTTGLERLVMIAVRGSGIPVDFRSLAQKALKRSRPDVARALGTPVGQFLQTALDGTGTKRAMRKTEALDYSVGLMSWHILKERRPKSK